MIGARQTSQMLTNKTVVIACVASCCRMQDLTLATVSSGLAALNMVQLWAKLDVAGVGLAFAHLMAVISPCLRMLDLMRVHTLFCGPGLLACGSALV